MEYTIISAASFEAQPTLEKLANHNIKLQALPCGIGPINAAKKLHKLTQEVSNRHVIFIGTCGSFYPFHQIELIMPKNVFWLPACERLDISASIEGLHEPFTLDSAQDWASSLPQRSVICCPNISLTDKLPNYFDTQTAVENLELYSVGKELHESAASFTPILAVTNQVGPKGRIQWKNNFKQAAIETALFLENQLAMEAK